MLINRLLKLPVRVWRRALAPWLPPVCRFHPSCSAYALEALDRHSWPRAVGLIAWRLARCNPFFQGGYDPVPPGQSPPHDPPTGRQSRTD
jgi:putative membrane protein insertion efficiency factor